MNRDEATSTTEKAIGVAGLRRVVEQLALYGAAIRAARSRAIAGIHDEEEVGGLVLVNGDVNGAVVPDFPDRQAAHIGSMQQLADRPPEGELEHGSRVDGIRRFGFHRDKTNDEGIDRL